MSLILDALNRSRQDVDPVPSLGTTHLTPTAQPGIKRYLPWGAVLVALLLVAWLLWEREEDAGATAGIAAPVAELSRNVGSAATAVTTQLKTRVAEQRRAQTPAPAQAAVPRQPPAVQQVSPAIQPEQLVQPQSVAKPVTVSPEQMTAVAQLYQQREATRQVTATSTATPQVAEKRDTVTRRQKEKPVDLEKMLEQARAQLKDDTLVEHPAPFIANLSQQLKDSIPSVLYQRHDYSDKASQSTVVLNGKSLRVGGSPVSGMKVDEILSDSVILSHRGTQFRLRALNSWVNL